MWVLKTEGSTASSLQYTLFAGAHAIGRSGPKPDNAGCDGWITFPGVDKSISRNHATITVHPLADPQAMDQRQPIWIRDRSKFGVSIDDLDERHREKGWRGTQGSQRSVHQIEKDKDVPLKQGCTITVGVNNSRLRLEWEEFIVCHSLLPKDQVPSLTSTCAQLGVQLSRGWSDRVRVLVMDQVQMTPKVLLSLIDQKDIVTSAYLTAIRKRANIGDPLPDPSATGVVWELGADRLWRHRITGETQDKEPPPEQMLVTHLYRPAFVEGFPEEYKEFVNDRGKGAGGLGAKTHLRASLLAHHTLIFLQGESGNVTLRQYKQVCERAKAKVEVWEAAQVVTLWSKYDGKLRTSANSIWHVLVPDDQPMTNVVGDALQLLRDAGVIYSTLDSLWRAVVTAQIACVEKDEFDLTQSLDASGQPDALSLPSGSNHPASGTQTKRDEKSVKSQSSGPSQGNQNKRPREEGEVSAPRGAGDGPTSGKAHAGGGKVGGDVIEIDGASEGSSDQSTPADGRAGKRMRVRGEVASSAPSQACTVTPARKAHDKTAARHEEKASQVHGADHPAQSSPATTKRQNAAEKQVAGQSGGAGSGKSPESAASHSRLSPPPVPGVPARQVRAARDSEASARSAGESDDKKEGSSSVNAAGGSSGRRGGAGEKESDDSPAHNRRFLLEDEANPDGWVAIISEGPAPHIYAPATGTNGLQGARTTGWSGSSAAGQAAVNWKRFHKKTDRAGPASGSGQGSAVPAPAPGIVFEVWPRRAAGEDTGAGGGGRARGAAGQRRRRGGSDDEE